MRTLLALLLVSGAAQATPEFVYAIPPPSGQGLPDAYYTDPTWPKLPSYADRDPMTTELLRRQGIENARYRSLTPEQRKAEDDKLRESLIEVERQKRR